MQKRITEKLKKKRKEQNISQIEIAKKLKISQSAYSRMENGEVELTFMQAIKIAEIFGDFLIWYIEENTKNEK